MDRPLRFAKGDLFHTEVKVGRPIGLEVRVSDEDHTPDRNAFGGGRNDHLRELRRLERGSDRCSYRRVAGGRPNEACARIEAAAKGAEVALIGLDRIMYVTRRVAIVPQYRTSLRLRDWDGLHRNRLVQRRQRARQHRRAGWTEWVADRLRFGDDLPLNVIRGQVFSLQIILKREHAAGEMMVDFDPIVAQQIALIVEILPRLGSRAGNRLRPHRCQMAVLKDRRRRPIDELASQRNLRIESHVALVLASQRAGKALEAAGSFVVVERRERATGVDGVIAATGESRRRIVRQQR